MQFHESVPRRWPGATCVVAGSGPSLTQQQADSCRAAGIRAVAVNDAHRLLPWADVLYACDAAWWKEHDGALDFKGERWSSHSEPRNEKLDTAKRWGLHLVHGAHARGFSLDQRRINYGQNSGFQAVNLALLFGATRVLLIGFDMHIKSGYHFFGRHGHTLRNTDPAQFIKNFNMAATDLLAHPGIEIVNCSPGSALTCFPQMDLECALSTLSPEVSAATTLMTNSPLDSPTSATP